MDFVDIRCDSVRQACSPTVASVIDVINTSSPVSFIGLVEVQKEHKVLAMTWHNLWCSYVPFKPDTKVNEFQLDVVRNCNAFVVGSMLPSAEVTFPSRWQRDDARFRPICLMRYKITRRLPRGVLY